MADQALEQKIIKQVEFYFSEANLKRDKFMQTTIANDADKAVSIDTLMTFNRLKKLSEDKNVIIEALKKSTELTLTEDSQKVKATVIPTQIEKNANLCVHLRGFPLSCNLDDILKGLEPYGAVQYIEMRRFKNKDFKGTVNVEFKTEEEAKAFLEKTIMFAGQEITDKSLLSTHNEEKKKAASKYAMRPNSLLKLTVEPDVTKEEILTILEPYQWTNFFLYFIQGDKHCIARLENKDKCEEAKAQLLDVLVKGKKIRPFILRGKQANDAWSKVKAAMQAEEQQAQEPKEEQPASVKRPAEEETVEDNKKTKQEEEEKPTEPEAPKEEEKQE
ncbi:hypothetical protein WA158_004567 [Blastocystis sp. Blastoise]